MLRKKELLKAYQHNSFEKSENEIFEMFQKESIFSYLSEYVIEYDFSDKVYLVYKIIK